MPGATTVNAQITDAVTQANVKVLGDAPAQSVALATQAMAHATGLAMQNAVQAQGGMQQINNTSTSALIAMIMNTGTRAKQDSTKQDSAKQDGTTTSRSDP